MKPWIESVGILRNSRFWLVQVSITSPAPAQATVTERSEATGVRKIAESTGSAILAV